MQWYLNKYLAFISINEINKYAAAFHCIYIIYPFTYNIKLLACALFAHSIIILYIDVLLYHKSRENNNIDLVHVYNVFNLWKTVIYLRVYDISVPFILYT